MKFFILFLLCSLIYLSLADEKNKHEGQAQVRSLDDTNEEARENQQRMRVERNPLFSFSASHEFKHFGPWGMGFAPYSYYGWGKK